MATRENKTILAFKNALIRANLLDENGSIVILVTGDDDFFLEKWHNMARHFIHKGKRVRVAMRVKRMNDGKVLCWPEVAIRDY